MIVWGGYEYPSWQYENNGAIYDPSMDCWQAIAECQELSEGRAGHVAFWTGSEMIVFGGSIYHGITFTGAIYNPENDTWRPLDTSGLGYYPTWYSVVWTGNDIIVWGGYDSGFSNNALVYNLENDSWTLLAPSGNCPSARWDHTAVWTGTKMIIWGGADNDAFLNTGGIFDPVTGEWESTSTADGCPTPRINHRAIWTEKGMLIWRGNSKDGTFFNDGALYNPETDEWTPVPGLTNVPAWVGRHTFTSTGDKAIMWGGEEGSEPFALDLKYVNNGYIFFVENQSWRKMNRGKYCPTHRTGHSAVWTGTSLIVWGGFDDLIDVKVTNTGGIFTP